MFSIVSDSQYLVYFPDAGAWKYVEQNRHAYFDKMQVFFYPLCTIAISNLILFINEQHNNDMSSQSAKF